MTKEYTPEEIKNRLSNIGEAIGNIAIEYIEELEKENAELKEEINKWKDEWQEQVQKENDESYARTLQTMKLTKAKEIIKDFLSLGIFGIFKGTTAEVIVDRAEQFLKECE